jgi:thiamine biosynthesis lipoprotein
MAGIQPVTVTKEVYQLISRYMQVHALGDGIYTMTHYLGNNKTAFSGVAKELDKYSTGKKNTLHLFRCVEFNKAKHTIFLTLHQLRLQLNGIARGYATGRVKHILKQNGILSGLIHWGADGIGWGNLSNGKNAA